MLDFNNQIPNLPFPSLLFIFRIYTKASFSSRGKLLHGDMQDTYHVESCVYTGQGFVVVENG